MKKQSASGRVSHCIFSLPLFLPHPKEQGWGSTHLAQCNSAGIGPAGGSHLVAYQVQEAAGIRHHHERERRKSFSLPHTTSASGVHRTSACNLPLAGRRGRLTTNRSFWGGRGSSPDSQNSSRCRFVFYHAGGDAAPFRDRCNVCPLRRSTVYLLLFYPRWAL